MSDLHTGREGNEIAAGYTPLADVLPKEEETTAPASNGVQQAADELTQADIAAGDADDSPIIEREIKWDNGKGKPLDDKVSLSAEQAAAFLTQAHNAEAAAVNEPATKSLQDAVDQFRGVKPAEQSGEWSNIKTQADIDKLQAEDWPRYARYQAHLEMAGKAASEVTPTPQAQPEGEPQQHPATDPEIAQALANPKIRTALEAHTNLVEQARVSYVNATSQNAALAVANLLVQFPEIGSVTPEQLPAVLDYIGKQDPAKAQAITAHLQRVQAFVGQADYAKAEQALQQRNQFAQFAKQQGEIFDDSVKHLPKETIKAAGDEIISMAKDYGIAKENMAHLWATEPVLHAAPFQRMMLDAALYRLSQKGINDRRSIPVPTVQRPGVSTGRSDRYDAEISALEAKFNKTGSPRDAANLLSAQQRAKG